MSIIIRKATLKDLVDIQNLCIETIANTCHKDYNPLQIKAWILSVQNPNKWKQAIQNEHFLVAEKNHLIVGFTSLRNGNYINFMYVHQDYLQQRIASLLYHNILTVAMKQSTHQLSADVSITARPFFEAKGFRVMKENINLINNVEIINYHMILKT